MQIDNAKFEHVAHVLGLIDQLIAFKQPGDYRLIERFKAETEKFNAIAIEFRESKVPELAAFGYRCQAVVREMEEYDRSAREKRPERTIKRQKRLLREALRKYVAAVHSLRLDERRDDMWLSI